MSTSTIHLGPALAILPTLPPKSVQACVTSPPYFRLRDYGVEGQIGLEETPAEYIEKLVAVFAQVYRVLRDDGTLWLNLGDSFAGSGGYSPNAPSNQTSKSGRQGRNGALIEHGVKPQGVLKTKDLCLMPHRVAIALQEWGWYVRSDIVWAKPNPMPESVKDRPTRSHEYVFLLSKSERYFYDLEATMEPRTSKNNKCGPRSRANVDRVPRSQLKQDALGKGTYTGFNERWQDKPTEMRQGRDVWHIATQPYPEAHFAVFPEDLPRRCILAGSRPGDVVLDPFAGSGTTLKVAKALGRQSVGIELNPGYEPLIRKRIG